MAVLESMTQTPDVAPPLAAASSQLSEGPLFVVGMFRSGTSLLYALLNQHPQIALMYEGDLAHLPSLFWFPTDTRTWLTKWNFWNAAVSRHKLDVSSLPAGVSDLRTAVREAYVAYAQRRKSGATIWGCKSPTYFDEGSRLARTVPNARFVIIWRDLRSICRSILKAAEKPSYFRRFGTMLRALIGYHELKVQCDQLQARGVPLHTVYYEELVRDPSGTMQGICEFLQIPFDPKMTSLEGADHSAIEDAPHHARVKAGKVVSSERDLAIPRALEDKIGRYLHLWKKQYSGQWPVYPRTLEGTADPTLWERFWDRLGYVCLQRWHHTTPIIFSFVPLRAWKIYRRLKGRPYASDLGYELRAEGPLNRR